MTRGRSRRNVPGVSRSADLLPVPREPDAEVLDAHVAPGQRVLAETPAGGPGRGRAVAALDRGRRREGRAVIAYGVPTLARCSECVPLGWILLVAPASCSVNPASIRRWRSSSNRYTPWGRSPADPGPDSGSSGSGRRFSSPVRYAHPDGMSRGSGSAAPETSDLTVSRALACCASASSRA